MGDEAGTHYTRRETKANPTAKRRRRLNVHDDLGASRAALGRVPSRMGSGLGGYVPRGRSAIINQADLDERGKQLSIMRPIYVATQSVRVWLG